MAPWVDSLELGSLGLTPGESRRLELAVAIPPLSLGGERYEVAPARVPVELDVTRPGSAYSLRLRFAPRLAGPCVRCLEPAQAEFRIDAREVHQDRAEDLELSSPYVSGEDLDVSAWARDALVLALPNQVVCREECLGLCAICGVNLNDEPEHAHESAPDPRWAKLSELTFE